MPLDRVADFEAVHGETGDSEIAGFVETAGHKAARIVIGVLEVERPGEIDVSVKVFEILLRQVGTAIDDVRTTPQDLVELRLIDGCQDAAEPEQDAALQAFGQPGDQGERGFATDQAEIANHPG